MITLDLCQKQSECYMSNNPITGYKVVYFTIKGTVYKKFNTRAEVSRFLIVKKPIMVDYVVYEMQGINTMAVVTQQFKV